MIVSRQPYGNANLHIDDQSIERINKFNIKYLGFILKNKQDSDGEESSNVRVAMARNVFARFDKYLLRQEVESQSASDQITNGQYCYEVETWSFKVKSFNRIETFEMWTLRRFLRILQIECLMRKYYIEPIPSTDGDN